jgi:hypothetical protein
MFRPLAVVEMIVPLRKHGIGFLVSASGADPDCEKSATKGRREWLIASCSDQRACLTCCEDDASWRSLKLVSKYGKLTLSFCHKL